jgi:hypothetical protein
MIIRICLILVFIRNAIRCFDFEKTRKFIDEWDFLVMNQILITYINFSYYIINFDKKKIIYKVTGIFLAIFGILAYYFGYHYIFAV